MLTGWPAASSCRQSSGVDVVSPAGTAESSLVAGALHPALASLSSSIASVAVAAPALLGELQTKESVLSGSAQFVALGSGHASASGQLGQVSLAAVKEAAEVAHSGG